MGTPVVNPSTGFVTAQVPVAYQLGPISAGADSPLGGLLAFASQVSHNYAAGLGLATASPATASAIIAGQPVSAAQVSAALQNNPNPTNSPFVGAGQTIGAVLGTGVNAIGTVTGVAGHQAAPGVATGAQQGVQGVTTVGAAGATGAFGGAIAGLGSGTATGLAGFSPSMLFVAGVVLVIILASR